MLGLCPLTLIKYAYNVLYLSYGKHVKFWSGLYKCSSPGHNKMASYDVITYKVNALKRAEDDYAW